MLDARTSLGSWDLLFSVFRFRFRISDTLKSIVSLSKVIRMNLHARSTVAVAQRRASVSVLLKIKISTKFVFLSCGVGWVVP